MERRWVYFLALVALGLFLLGSVQLKGNAYHTDYTTGSEYNKYVPLSFDRSSSGTVVIYGISTLLGDKNIVVKLPSVAVVDEVGRFYPIKLGLYPYGYGTIGRYFIDPDNRYVWIGVSWSGVQRPTKLYVYFVPRGDTYRYESYGPNTFWIYSDPNYGWSGWDFTNSGCSVSGGDLVCNQQGSQRIAHRWFYNEKWYADTWYGTRVVSSLNITAYNYNMGFDIGFDINRSGYNDGYVYGYWYLPVFHTDVGDARLYYHSGTTWYRRSEAFGRGVPLGEHFIDVRLYRDAAGIRYDLAADGSERASLTDSSVGSDNGGYFAMRELRARVHWIAVMPYAGDPEYSILHRGSGYMVVEFNLQSLPSYNYLTSNRYYVFRVPADELGLTYGDSQWLVYVLPEFLPGKVELNILATNLTPDRNYFLVYDGPATFFDWDLNMGTPTASAGLNNKPVYDVQVAEGVVRVSYDYKSTSDDFRLDYVYFADLPESIRNSRCEMRYSVYPAMNNGFHEYEGGMDGNFFIWFHWFGSDSSLMVGSVTCMTFLSHSEPTKFVRAYINPDDNLPTFTVAGDVYAQPGDYSITLSVPDDNAPVLWFVLDKNGDYTEVVAEGNFTGAEGTITLPDRTYVDPVLILWRSGYRPVVLSLSAPSEGGAETPPPSTGGGHAVHPSELPEAPAEENVPSYVQQASPVSAPSTGVLVALVVVAFLVYLMVSRR